MHGIHIGGLNDWLESIVERSNEPLYFCRVGGAGALIIKKPCAKRATPL